MFSGKPMQASALTTTNSAWAPPPVMKATGVPTGGPLAPGPWASTLPAASIPGKKGGLGPPEYAPSRCSMSAPLSPQALTRINSSPSPGFGIGTSRMRNCSTLPNPVTSAVFIIVWFPSQFFWRHIWHRARYRASNGRQAFGHKARPGDTGPGRECSGN